MIALLFGKSGWLTSINALYLHYNHTTTTTISVQKQSWLHASSGNLAGWLPILSYWGVTPLLRRARRTLHVFLHASFETIHKTWLLDYYQRSQKIRLNKNQIKKISYHTKYCYCDQYHFYYGDDHNYLKSCLTFLKSYKIIILILIADENHPQTSD